MLAQDFLTRAMAMGWAGVAMVAVVGALALGAIWVTGTLFLRWMRL